MSSLNRRHVGSHDCHVVAENKLRQYDERGPAIRLIVYSRSG